MRQLESLQALDSKLESKPDSKLECSTHNSDQKGGRLSPRMKNPSEPDVNEKNRLSESCVAETGNTRAC